MSPSSPNIPFPKLISTPIFRPDLNIRLICPDCKNPNPKLIEEFASGDMVCGECGLVLDGKIIDTRSEWRTFSSNDEGNKDPSRIGAASDPLDPSALDTSISWQGSTNNEFSSSPSLSRTHFKATVNKSNVSLRYVLQEIESICHSMDLSMEIIETTKQLYRRSNEEKILRGKNKVVIYAACIYIACRIMNVGRSLKEIIAVTRVSKGHLSRAIKILVSTFDLNLKQMTSEDLMARFCNRLGISPEVTGISTKVSQRIEQLGLLTGRTQNTVAAAVILFVTIILKYPISIDNISNVSGMATPSIKGVCRMIEAEKDKFQDLFPCAAITSNMNDNSSGININVGDKEKEKNRHKF
ncbi:900_t:CDS:2 [Diversispora eburnea]|uniref:Transcription initiation factor IIB n=1 Tax=Diversispora eburnea TaxID=1213867 RepID=A0A9N9ASC2_9GLOM|nr:900_t:CDS:2 [Diversispora eburnea]